MLVLHGTRTVLNSVSIDDPTFYGDRTSFQQSFVYPMGAHMNNDKFPERMKKVFYFS